MNAPTAEEHLGLVHLCANRFRGRGMEYEDLYSAGCIGLLKAVKAFDCTRGVQFSTYAVPVILGNLFQLFYTLADSVIVGKTLGADSDLLAHQILRWMQIPDDISGEAYDYMFVVFLGTGATVFYNMISNMLRALGDSKTPLYFLVFSSVLNIFLDILFIVPFHMGVAGAAWATILSQFLSALFSLIVGLKNFPVLLQSPDIRLLPRQIRFQFL